MPKSLVASGRETAPALVSVWRDLADRLMELCRAEPPLLDRVTKASRPNFHAYAMYFAASLDKPAETVARTAYDTRPKDLLAKALAKAAPVAPVWRLLKQVEADHALPLQTYRRLAALAETPRLGVLMRAHEIDDRTLDAFETLNRLMADDDGLLAAAAAGIVPAVPRNVVRTREMLLLLRAHGVADDRLRARLARCRAMHDVQRAVAGAFHRMKLPDLALDFGPELKRPRSVKDLLRVGRDFANCLAGLPPHVIDDFVAGRFVLLEHRRDGQPHALVTLELVSRFATPVLARVQSVLGPKNRRVGDGAETEIRRLLHAVPGLALMEHDLASTLRAIVEAHTDDADPDLDELGIMLEEADDELVPL